MSSTTIQRNVKQNHPVQIYCLYYFSCPQKDTPDILDCDERRWFWLSWERRGIVNFGRGSRLYVDEILTLEDPEPHVPSYVGLTAYNEETTEWDIPYIQGKINVA